MQKTLKKIDLEITYNKVKKKVELGNRGGLTTLDIYVHVSEKRKDLREIRRPHFNIILR